MCANIFPRLSLILHTILNNAPPTCNRNRGFQAATDSYHNLVGCSLGRNSEKTEQPTSDFLGALYWQGRLNSCELEERLAALDALGRGELKPLLDASMPATPSAPWVEPCKQDARRSRSARP